jgi:hypothetical protein
VPLVVAFIALWAVVAVLAGGGSDPADEAAPDPPASTSSTDVERSVTSRPSTTTGATDVVPGSPLLGEP